MQTHTYTKRSIKVNQQETFMQNDNINGNDNDDNDAHKSNLPRPTCCGVFHDHNFCYFTKFTKVIP